MKLTLWHKAMIFSLVLNISVFGITGVWSQFAAQQQQPLTEIIVDLSIPMDETAQQSNGLFSPDNIEPSEFEPAETNPLSAAESLTSASSAVIQSQQEFPSTSGNANMTEAPTSAAAPTKSSAPQAGSMGITPPKLLKRIQPVYPEIARRNGASGTVKVKALILKDGSVGDCSVIASSGYPELDEAALNAVQAGQFSPAIDRATRQPIKSYVALSVSFSLNKR
ncbi:MAG: energy transducer TonB [Veillonellaceae bacterium]|jgi:protein TonB|nr:energy transducer TonB [Veillonellaceae bacterium]